MAKSQNRKGKQFMLQFLQTGKVLYVLATVCGLGVISKLVTSSLYKRLVKETGNMALTKNRNLRLFRQRTENMLMLSHGIRNTNAYIEKQLYGFRFMKLSLDGWDNLAVQAMILCFLIGGLAAFGAYWYRCDSYYIVLYGTMGILTGLFMVLVDNSVNISLKRQQLMDCLVDYVDNTPHYFRSVDKSAEKKLKVVAEPATSAQDADQGKKLPLVSALSKKRKRNEPIVTGNAGGKEKRNLVSEEELRKSIDGLKQSLEQIAASREQTGTGINGKAMEHKEADESVRTKKELNPEELKILGELLQEYLT